MTQLPEQHASAFAGAACFGDWDIARGDVCWSAPLADVIREPVAEAPVPLDWWRDRILSADRAAAVAVAEAALAGAADRYECRYRIRRADGAEVRIRERSFIVRERERPIRVVSTILEAHVEPSSEDASSLLAWVEQSVERFRTFVEGLPLLAWAMTPEGWIYYYNQRWYEYTGTTLEQMDGWGWVAVHDPNDLARVLQIFRRALATGEMWEDEFRLRRADGVMRWHLSRAMPLRNDEGRVIHWFGTNTDIHDQKLALEERSRLLVREQEGRREAEAASRAKDEFLATLSHELRTPLNAIVGWTHVLVAEALTAAQRRAVDAIDRSARQQAVLIADLLDTSRILSGKMQIEMMPTVLFEAVAAAVESIRPRAGERNIELTVIDETDGARVVGDPARLQQVASNLLSNASKFSSPGGRVEVRLLRREKLVVLEVEDEGEEIDPDFLPRIFGRFQQADSSSTRRHGGLGLGLSIVRQLVELHGGTVCASSAGRGRGATFTVQLPSAADVGPVLTPATAPLADEAPISLRGITVLVLDDDPETRDLLCALLLGRGASVAAAGSAAEALDSMRANVPNVVISDIAMPDVDGYGFVERVRALRDSTASGVPILALTAYASIADRDRALAGGFDDYLTKPIEPGRLVRTVAALVRRRAIGTE